MTTGSEILLRQRRYYQRVMNIQRSRMMNLMTWMPNFDYPKPKLKIDLNTGNIFRDAFQFLWPLRYEYPDMPKGNDTIRIRRPIKYGVRKPGAMDIRVASFAEKDARPVIDVKKVAKEVREIRNDHEARLGPLLNAPYPYMAITPPRPLFFTRREIATKCEEWCVDNGLTVCPLNIITAAFKLGLVKR